MDDSDVFTQDNIFVPFLFWSHGRINLAVDFYLVLNVLNDEVEDSALFPVTLRSYQNFAIFMF